MNKKIFISVVLVVFIVFGVVFYFAFKGSFYANHPVACTMEAKLCPDGTSVGRSGPNCDFAPCPNATTTSPTESVLGYLTGQVTLSPTCPVERIPPDPACAPKPYSTFVIISGAANFYMELHTDTSGFFRTPLPAGNYDILVHQETLYPRCETKTVTITVGATTTADISCDTGIR